jgi:hypothetical protein
MSSLITFIKRILTEDAAFGEEWLSPKVVNFLISTYAKESSILGKLKWQYGSLPSRIWGRYSPHYARLTVNKAKTKNMFKQQVNTILHEIQHWNQHVKHGEEKGGDIDRQTLYRSITAQWRWNGSTYGYRASPHEVDARAFAEKNVNDALSRAGRHAAGKIEVEDKDEAWEEILDVLSDYDEITRKEIGQELMDFGMNDAKNMQRAIKDLKDLGVVIK